MNSSFTVLKRDARQTMIVTGSVAATNLSNKSRVSTVSTIWRQPYIIPISYGSVRLPTCFVWFRFIHISSNPDQSFTSSLASSLVTCTTKVNLLEEQSHTWSWCSARNWSIIEEPFALMLEWSGSSLAISSIKLRSSVECFCSTWWSCKVR